MAFTKTPVTKRACVGCGKLIYTYNAVGRCAACRAEYNSVPNKFWRKVDREGPVARVPLSPCWAWTGARFSNGYGHLQVKDRSELAHRLSLSISGVDPVGSVALHACDNRACVNPAHLSLGTMLDNARDCRDKGRNNSGDRNGMSATKRAALGFAPNFPFDG